MMVLVEELLDATQTSLAAVEESAMLTHLALERTGLILGDILEELLLEEPPSLLALLALETTHLSESLESALRSLFVLPREVKPRLDFAQLLEPPFCVVLEEDLSINTNLTLISAETMLDNKLSNLLEMEELFTLSLRS